MERIYLIIYKFLMLLFMFLVHLLSLFIYLIYVLTVSYIIACFISLVL